MFMHHIMVMKLFKFNTHVLQRSDGQVSLVVTGIYGMIPTQLTEKESERKQGKKTSPMFYG